MPLFALTLYHWEQSSTGDWRLILHAMPVMIGVLCVLAIAYRFYSKFLAAKVACLDDTRPTPATTHPDGQNYHPTNKWVLFGHHFAAISGAGPLIGPVLAIQYGYMPGLLWLVIGVCLAGAVQDMLVLAASVRRDGKSIAEIAKHELGKPAALISALAILFIITIALAGLGIVVVKALGGEEAKLPAGMEIKVPEGKLLQPVGEADKGEAEIYEFPAGCSIRYTADSAPVERSEAFRVKVPRGFIGKNELLALIDTSGSGLRPVSREDKAWLLEEGAKRRGVPVAEMYRIVLPAGCTQVVPGSSWGTFTIACTIPIAVFVGLLMKFWKRVGVLAGSIIGGGLTLGAVVVGGWIPGSPLEPFFSLSKEQTAIALAIYGFVAAVLPVWLLLGPRDYLSSFLKIGTVILLVASVCIANPALQAPMLNEVYQNGGPTFAGNIFPFVFICVMCGAVSGFHSLVSSGTTPKMIEKESHVRPIGYGAMLIEGVVGVTALIASAALPNELYYDINVPIDKVQVFQKKQQEMNEKYPPLANAGTDVAHLNLGTVEQQVGGESLRGRTGGAVTLAVGMSVVFDDTFKWVGVTGDWLLKYWYHFAIMFEALFILTTIDAGTRIGRFLLQETVGKVYPKFARPDWLPGALIASAVITAGWGWLIYTGSVDTIWPMFGVANQSLAILALAIVTTWLVNTGRGRWSFVTIVPMLWVCSTTLTAATNLVTERFPTMISDGQKLADAGNSAGHKAVITGGLSIAMTVFVVACVGAVVLWSAARWVGVATGKVPTRKE
jgi:carbon starvation protein